MVAAFSSGEFVTLPARAVMIAAGTHPNTTYDREHPGTFELDEKGEFYRAYKVEKAGGGKQLVPAGRGEIGFFTSYEKEGRYVTFFGDNHPHYAGNVVKAMASAKDGHREIARAFEEDVTQQKAEDQPDGERNWVLFAESLDEQLVAEVVDAMRLTHQMVEVMALSPWPPELPSRRVLSLTELLKRLPKEVDGIKLTMEGIALTGAWVDSGTRLDFAHRAGNGRQQPTVFVAGTGRENCAHGPDRHSHRDTAQSDGRSRRWRPGQCRPSFLLPWL